MAGSSHIADQVKLLEDLAETSLITGDGPLAEALNAAIVALNASPPRRPLKGRRPPWWSDQPVRELVLGLYREATLDAVVAECAAKFGPPRAPSRSSVGRVWQRIDRGHLIKGIW